MYCTIHWIANYSVDSLISDILTNRAWAVFHAEIELVIIARGKLFGDYIATESCQFCDLYLAVIKSFCY